LNAIARDDVRSIVDRVARPNVDLGVDTTGIDLVDRQRELARGQRQNERESSSRHSVSLSAAQ